MLDRENSEILGRIFAVEYLFRRSRVRRSAVRRSDETQDTGVMGNIEPISRYMQLEGESK